MGKLGKKIVGAILLLLLILVMGCSLKIEIDPSRLEGTESPESQEVK